MSEELQQRIEPVLGTGSGTVDTDPSLIDIVRETVAARSAPERWEEWESETWAHFSPPGHADRDQGWKVHVSATPVSAPDVVGACARVLSAARCPFKIARDLDTVEMLVSSSVDRGAGGKVVTVYPVDDDQFRTVVAGLDEATRGLPGPVILSDQQLRPGSVVHYRFGGFAPRQVLSNEGMYQYVLTGPDGSQVQDQHKPWFNPPTWATPPIEGAPRPRSDAERGRPVRIADRFVVREAIRLSFKGGVYRAHDERTGRAVILKQARPHAGADRRGDDARAWLRHEADLLERLAPLGQTPSLVAVVDYQGDAFLAEEELDGRSLRHWVAERAAATRSEVPHAEAVEMAVGLVRLLRSVHDAGYVVRDFNPGNVVVPSDGRPRLVDVEFVARIGSTVRNVVTPGYAAPEQVAAGRWGTAPSTAADAYSLGATLMHLATRVDPVFPDDHEEPARRTLEERWDDVLAATRATGAAMRLLAPVIAGLTRTDPARRWSLADAERRLAEIARRGDDGAGAPAGPDDLAAARLAPARRDRLVADGLVHTLRTMDPDGPNLWPPVVAEGLASDACNVQSGAAGVVGMLTAAARTEHGDVLPGLEVAAGWLRDQLFRRDRRVLPGLYFGRSGVAWALYEAGRMLADDRLVQDALAIARRVPLRWPNPDVTHGLTGAGTVMLHLWERTGLEEFAERAATCAEAVAAG